MNSPPVLRIFTREEKGKKIEEKKEDGDAEVFKEKERENGREEDDEEEGRWGGRKEIRDGA